MRELAQGLDHLTGPLSASRHDDDVHAGVTGDELLQDRLARSEGAGDTGRSALGHGIERVDDPAAGDERLHGQDSFLVLVQGDLDGPFLHHGEVAGLAPLVLDLGNGLRDRVASLLGHLLHLGLADEIEGNEDLVGENSLRDRTQDIPRLDRVACFGHGREFPLFRPVEAVEIDAALEEEPAVLGELWQGILETVVNLFQQARAELDDEQVPGELHRIAHLDIPGVLEDLHVADRAAYSDHLAFQLAVPGDHIGHLVL